MHGNAITVNACVLLSPVYALLLTFEHKHCQVMRLCTACNHVRHATMHDMQPCTVCNHARHAITVNACVLLSPVYALLLTFQQKHCQVMQPCTTCNHVRHATMHDMQSCTVCNHARHAITVNACVLLSPVYAHLLILQQKHFQATQSCTTLGCCSRRPNSLQKITMGVISSQVC